MLRQTLTSKDGGGGKAWEIGAATLPRYYWTYYNSGVENIQMVMESVHEMALPGGGHFVESGRCSYIYWYANGHQVSNTGSGGSLPWHPPLTSDQIVATGSLKAQFNPQGRIEVLDHGILEFKEYIARADLLARQAESPEQKASPNVSKSTGKKAAARMQRQNTVDQHHAAGGAFAIPKSPVNEWGITDGVLQLIEVGILP